MCEERNTWNGISIKRGGESCGHMGEYRWLKKKKKFLQMWSSLLPVP